MLALGASPRAAICLLRVAQAFAAFEDRDYIIPDDVKRAVLPVLRHRILLSSRRRSLRASIRIACSAMLWPRSQCRGDESFVPPSRAGTCRMRTARPLRVWTHTAHDRAAGRRSSARAARILPRHVGIRNAHVGCAGDARGDLRRTAIAYRAANHDRAIVEQRALARQRNRDPTRC